MNPTKLARQKPVAIVAEVQRIRDLSGELSSLMGRIDLLRSGFDPGDWYAINRVFRDANRQLEALTALEAAPE